MDEISITGMGIVSSNAHNVEEFNNALINGTSAFGISKELGDNDVVGGFISDFDFMNNLETYSTECPRIVNLAKRYLKKSDIAMQTTVSACMEAWVNSKLNCDEVDEQEIGIVVAGSNLSQAMIYNMVMRKVKGDNMTSPSYALRYLDTNYVGVLSDLFKIKGEGFCIGGASASGNVAIINACRMLKEGRVKVCFVVGPMTTFSPLEIDGFTNMGALGGKSFMNAPNKASRPMDQEHEGFIYGQASACIILENLDHAKKRDANIQGIIRGYGQVLDANRSSDCRHEGEVRAIKKAIESAEIQIDSIDYINLHGTSTPLGDEVEIGALESVFGENLESIMMNSTKGLTGHCIFSAAIVELIATILQLNGQYVHENKNLTCPINTKVNLLKSIKRGINIRNALSNSFGFGGINTSIVISRYMP